MQVRGQKLYVKAKKVTFVLQEHTTMCYSFYLLFTNHPGGWYPASWQDVL